MNYVIKKQKLIKYLRIVREIFKLRKEASFFKSLYYSLKFRGKVFVGKKSSINSHKTSKIIIKNNGTLRIGMDYKYPLGTSIYLNSNAKIIVNGYSRIMKGCYIEVLSGAVLELGLNSFLNEQSRVRLYKRLYIGNNSIISFKVHIMDSDAHKIAEFGEDVNQISEDDVTQEIVIGDHVWIGANSVILKGVKIGKGAVVGAGSVVTKNIPGNVLAVGNPCKVIKEDITWKF